MFLGRVVSIRGDGMGWGEIKVRAVMERYRLVGWLVGWRDGLMNMYYTYVLNDGLIGWIGMP